ncbi:MAG: hypothetical protein HRU06_03815 [Oceanospirillaceae bacterium]|nr:hypothetical protein [Oceanospirillaceae bacterium]
MLPMGTIMAVSMLLGVLITTDLAVIKSIKKLPSLGLKGVAIIVMLSGLWNVFWYASQHLGEFWGNAALVSGLLMILVSLYSLIPEKLPAMFISIKPLILLLLLGCSVLYGFTIYNL